MSNLQPINVTVEHFHHTKDYQYIRPKADQLMPVQKFLDRLVCAPSVEEAQSTLSQDISSWDYYTNWMDGQREIAIVLATNKPFLARLNEAATPIVEYLQGVSLSQRLVQLTTELEKYPTHSTKWNNALDQYKETYSALIKIDQDYKSLLPEVPGISETSLSPFVEHLAKSGHFLALHYIALHHLRQSNNESLSAVDRDAHFKTGFAFLDKACVKGVNEAIITMGEIYEKLFHEVNSNDKQTEKMYMNMVKHYDLAARRRDPNAYARLGHCLLSPTTFYDFNTRKYHGSTAQTEPGLLFLRHASDQDSTMAYVYLAEYALSIKQVHHAIDLYEKAAENEFLEAMIELDKLYFNKVHQSKPQIANQFRIKAAENRYRMGRLYETGHCPSGQPEYKEAQAHYLKSMTMERGPDPSPQIKAALALSRLARDGKGIQAPNAALSLMYLKKAADMGDVISTLVVACYSLAPQDPNMKVNWEQGRLYLNKLRKSEHLFDEADLHLIQATLDSLIKQAIELHAPKTDDEIKKALELNETIYDLSQLAHNTQITIASLKAIGNLYAHVTPDKVKAHSYYQQAIMMGDIASHIDIGFLSLADNDPAFLPNIDLAMEAFKTATKLGITISDDLILRIAKQVIELKKQYGTSPIITKALSYDIKFLKDYNWVERTYFSGIYPNKKAIDNVPNLIEWLKNETVLEPDDKATLLSAFEKIYPDSKY